MTVTKANQYALAGWLAIISAILVVPEIVLSVLSEFISPYLNLFVLLVHTVSLIVGIYILYMFRQLLNRQFSFHRADVLIITLIVANVVFFVIGVAEIAADTMNMTGERILSLITIILFVPFSIVTVAFGVVLLKMKDDLFGLLKPFAYTTIGSGICGATIILVPLGLLAALVALVMQGMIFLRAGRDAEIL